MAKSNTNLKSGTEADLKMLKMSEKCNVYLLVNTLISFSKHNFLEYSVQKVPENSSKTSLLGCVSK